MERCAYPFFAIRFPAILREKSIVADFSVHVHIYAFRAKETETFQRW